MTKQTEISMHATDHSRTHKIRRRQEIDTFIPCPFEPLHGGRRSKHGSKKSRRKNHRRAK